MDIRSRVKAFRLQTVKGLLYGEDVSWAEVACNLLRKAGNMGLDRHLFLMDINRMDLSRLTVFYRSILTAWTVCRVSRGQNGVQRMWLKEEPILFNPALDLNVLKSLSLRRTLKTAKLLKVGQF